MAMCSACNDSGYKERSFSLYGEPQDYKLVPCHCPIGRRVAKRERWERYQEQVESQRRHPRPATNAIGF